MKQLCIPDFRTRCSELPESARRCRYRGTAKAGRAAIVEVFAPPAFATIRSCRGSVVLMFLQPGAEAGRNRVPNRMRTSRRVAPRQT